MKQTETLTVVVDSNAKLIQKSALAGAVTALASVIVGQIAHAMIEKAKKVTKEKKSETKLQSVK